MIAERKIATVLNSAPAYTEAELTIDGRDTVHRLMVRDIPTFDPDAERRCTNLTTGTEWFITTESLERVGVSSFAVTKWITAEWRLL